MPPWLPPPSTSSASFTLPRPAFLPPPPPSMWRRYESDETPMSSYLNVHDTLEAQRTKARASCGEGPRTLVSRPHAALRPDSPDSQAALRCAATRGRAPSAAAGLSGRSSAERVRRRGPTATRRQAAGRGACPLDGPRYPLLPVAPRCACAPAPFPPPSRPTRTPHPCLPACRWWAPPTRARARCAGCCPTTRCEPPGLPRWSTWT